MSCLLPFRHCLTTVIVTVVILLLPYAVKVDATSDRYSGFSNDWSYSPESAGMALNAWSVTPTNSQGWNSWAYLSWQWSYEAKFHGWVETYQRVKTGDRYGTATALNCVSAGGYGSSIQSVANNYKSCYSGSQWLNVLGYLNFAGDTSKISGGMSCSGGYTRFDTHSSAGGGYSGTSLQWAFLLNWDLSSTFCWMSICWTVPIGYLERTDYDHMDSSYGGQYESDLYDGGYYDSSRNAAYNLGWTLAINCYASWSLGFWRGPRCMECYRGFATSGCNRPCPGQRPAGTVDGITNDWICSGNGRCDQGIYGTSQCYCKFGYFGIDCSWQFLAVGDGLGNTGSPQYQLSLVDWVAGAAYTGATLRWIGTYYGTTSFHRVRLDPKHFVSNTNWRGYMNTLVSSMFVLQTQNTAYDCSNLISPRIYIPLTILSSPPAYSATSFPFASQNGGVAYLKFDTSVTNLGSPAVLDVNGFYSGICRCPVIAGAQTETDSPYRCYERVDTSTQYSIGGSQHCSGAYPTRAWGGGDAWSCDDASSSGSSNNLDNDLRLRFVEMGQFGRYSDGSTCVSNIDRIRDPYTSRIWQYGSSCWYRCEANEYNGGSACGISGGLNTNMNIQLNTYCNNVKMYQYWAIQPTVSAYQSGETYASSPTSLSTSSTCSIRTGLGVYVVKFTSIVGHAPSTSTYPIIRHLQPTSNGLWDSTNEEPYLTVDSFTSNTIGASFTGMGNIIYDRILIIDSTSAKSPGCMSTTYCTGSAWTGDTVNTIVYTTGVSLSNVFLTEMMYYSSWFRIMLNKVGPPANAAVSATDAWASSKNLHEILWRPRAMYSPVWAGAVTAVDAYVGVWFRTGHRFTVIDINGLGYDTSQTRVCGRSGMTCGASCSCPQQSGTLNIPMRSGKPVQFSGCTTSIAFAMGSFPLHTLVTWKFVSETSSTMQLKTSTPSTLFNIAVNVGTSNLDLTGPTTASYAWTVGSFRGSYQSITLYAYSNTQIQITWPTAGTITYTIPSSKTLIDITTAYANGDSCVMSDEPRVLVVYGWYLHQDVRLMLLQGSCAYQGASTPRRDWDEPSGTNYYSYPWKYDRAAGVNQVTDGLIADGWNSGAYYSNWRLTINPAYASTLTNAKVCANVECGPNTGTCTYEGYGGWRTAKLPGAYYVNTGLTVQMIEIWAIDYTTNTHTNNNFQADNQLSPWYRYYKDVSAFILERLDNGGPSIKVVVTSAASPCSTSTAPIGATSVLNFGASTTAAPSANTVDGTNGYNFKMCYKLDSWTSGYQFEFPCPFAPAGECLRIVRLNLPTCTDLVESTYYVTPQPCRIDTTNNIIWFRANQDQPDPNLFDATNLYHYQVWIPNGGNNKNVNINTRIFLGTCPSGNSYACTDTRVRRSGTSCTTGCYVSSGKSYFAPRLTYDYVKGQWFFILSQYQRGIYTGQTTVTYDLAVGVYSPIDTSNEACGGGCDGTSNPQKFFYRYRLGAATEPTVVLDGVKPAFSQSQITGSAPDNRILSSSQWNYKWHQGQLTVSLYIQPATDAILIDRTEVAVLRMSNTGAQNYVNLVAPDYHPYPVNDATKIASNYFFYPWNSQLIPAANNGCPSTCTINIPVSMAHGDKFVVGIRQFDHVMNFNHIFSAYITVDATNPPSGSNWVIPSGAQANNRQLYLLASNPCTYYGLSGCTEKYRTMLNPWSGKVYVRDRFVKTKCHSMNDPDSGTYSIQATCKKNGVNCYAGYASSWPLPFRRFSYKNCTALFSTTMISGVTPPVLGLTTGSTLQVTFTVTSVSDRTTSATSDVIYGDLTKPYLRARWLLPDGYYTPFVNPKKTLRFKADYIDLQWEYNDTVSGPVNFWFEFVCTPACPTGLTSNTSYTSPYISNPPTGTTCYPAAVSGKCETQTLTQRFTVTPKFTQKHLITVIIHTTSQALWDANVKPISLMYDETQPAGGYLKIDNRSPLDNVWQYSSSEIKTTWWGWEDPQSNISYYDVCFWNVGTNLGCYNHAYDKFTYTLFSSLFDGVLYYASLMVVSKCHALVISDVSTTVQQQVYVDGTPPIDALWVSDGNSVVTDLKYMLYTSPIIASWPPMSDPHSGMFHYAVSIRPTRNLAPQYPYWVNVTVGSCSGQCQTDTSGGQWTTNTPAWSNTYMVPAEKYVVVVRGFNHASHFTEMQSNGVVVDATPPDGPTGLNDGIGGSIEPYPTGQYIAQFGMVTYFDEYPAYRWAQSVTTGLTCCRRPLMNKTFYVLTKCRSKCENTTGCRHAAYSPSTQRCILYDTCPKMWSDVYCKSKNADNVVWSRVNEGTHVRTWSLLKSGAFISTSGCPRLGLMKHMMNLWDAQETCSRMTGCNGIVYRPAHRQTYFLACPSPGLLTPSSSYLSSAGTNSQWDTYLYMPPPRSHTDISWQSSTTQISGNWPQFSDAESGLASLTACIQTTLGGACVNPAGWINLDFNSTGHTIMGLTLTPGLATTYYWSVIATNNLAQTTVRYSNGVKVDNTGPVLSTVYKVNDGGHSMVDASYVFSWEYLTATWTNVFSDPESGIHHYTMRAGTTVGGDNVMPETIVGTRTSVGYKFSELAPNGLPDDCTIYICVKAYNGAGTLLESCTNGAIFNLNVSQIWDAQDGLPRFKYLWWRSTPPDEKDYQDYNWRLEAHWQTHGTVHETRVCISSNKIQALPAPNQVNCDIVGLTRVYQNTTVIFRFGAAIVESLKGRHSVEFAPGFPVAIVNVPLTKLSLNKLNDGYYTVLIQVWNHGGLWNASTDGVVVDVSRPNCGLVWEGLGSTDLKYTSSATSLSAHWFNFADPHSNIYEYYLSVSTKPLKDDIVVRHNVGLTTSVTYSSLSLAHGQKYYFNIWAYNFAGLMCNRTSDGIWVDLTPPVATKICDGKGWVDSTDKALAILFGDASGCDLTFTQTAVISANWRPFQEDVSWCCTYSWAVGTKIYAQNTRTLASIGYKTNATASVPSLVAYSPWNRQKFVYYTFVVGTNAVGLSSAMTSNGVKYAPILQPFMMSVSIGTTPQNLRYWNSLTTLKAYWTCDNTLGALTKYDISIGQPPAFNQILNLFTITTSATTYAVTQAVTFTNGQEYYLTVRATNVATNTDTMRSRPFLVDTSSPTLVTAPIVFVEDLSNTVVAYSPSKHTAYFYWLSSFAPSSSGITNFEVTITSTGSFSVTNYDVKGNGYYQLPTLTWAEQGKTLSLSVKAWGGNGLYLVPTALTLIVDFTPPQAGKIYTKAYHGKKSYFSAVLTRWMDWESGMKTYQWCLGSTNQTCDFFEWADTKGGDRVTARNLTLRHSSNLYVNVLGYNKANLGTYASSERILIDLTPPVTDVQALVNTAGTTTVTVTWNSTEPDSGVWKHYVRLENAKTKAVVVTDVDVGNVNTYMMTYAMAALTSYRAVVTSWNFAGLSKSYYSPLLSSAQPTGGWVIDVKGPGEHLDIDAQSNQNEIWFYYGGFIEQMPGVILQYEYSIRDSQWRTIKPFTRLADVGYGVYQHNGTLKHNRRYHVQIRVCSAQYTCRVVESDGVLIDTTPCTVLKSLYVTTAQSYGGNLYQRNDSYVTIDFDGVFQDKESGILETYWSIGPRDTTDSILALTRIVNTTRPSVWLSIELAGGSSFVITVIAYNGAYSQCRAVALLFVDSTPPVAPSRPIFPGTDGARRNWWKGATLSATWQQCTDDESGIDTSAYKIGAGMSPKTFEYLSLTAIPRGTPVGETQRLSTSVAFGITPSHGSIFYITMHCTSNSGLVTSFVSGPIVMESTTIVAGTVSFVDGAVGTGLVPSLGGTGVRLVASQSNNKTATIIWYGFSAPSTIEDYHVYMYYGTSTPVVRDTSVGLTSRFTGIWETPIPDGQTLTAQVTAYSAAGTQVVSRITINIDSSPPVFPSYTGVRVGVTPGTHTSLITRRQDFGVNFDGCSDPHSPSVATFVAVIGDVTEGKPVIQDYVQLNTLTKPLNGPWLTDGRILRVRVKCVNAAGLVSIRDSLPSAVVLQHTVVIDSVSLGPFVNNYLSTRNYVDVDVTNSFAYNTTVQSFTIDLYDAAVGGAAVASYTVPGYASPVYMLPQEVYCHSGPASFNFSSLTPGAQSLCTLDGTNPQFSESAFVVREKIHLTGVGGYTIRCLAVHPFLSSSPQTTFKINITKKTAYTLLSPPYGTMTTSSSNTIAVQYTNPLPGDQFVVLRKRQGINCFAHGPYSPIYRTRYIDQSRGITYLPRIPLSVGSYMLCVKQGASFAEVAMLSVVTPPTYCPSGCSSPSSVEAKGTLFRVTVNPGLLPADLPQQLQVKVSLTNIGGFTSTASSAVVSTDEALPAIGPIVIGHKEQDIITTRSTVISWAMAIDKESTVVEYRAQIWQGFKKNTTNTLIVPVRAVPESPYVFLGLQRELDLKPYLFNPIEDRTIYYVRITAIDLVGRINIRERNFTTDLVPPVVLKGPSLMLDARGDVLRWDLRWSCHDTNGVSDQAAIIGLAPARPEEHIRWRNRLRGSATWQALGGRFKVGESYIGTVRCTDRFGQSKLFYSNPVVYNMRPPAYVFNGRGLIFNKVQSRNTGVLVDFSGFSDPDDGLANFYVQIGSTPGRYYPVASVANVQGLNLADGCYTVFIRAVDRSNLTVTATDNVCVYRTAPTVGKVYDGPTPFVDVNWTTNLTHVHASWSGFRDTGAGLKYYSFGLMDLTSHTTLINNTNVGLRQTIVATSPFLRAGNKYMFWVTAVDNLMKSVTGYSDGFRIVRSMVPPFSLTPVSHFTTNSTHLNYIVGGAFPRGYNCSYGVGVSIGGNEVIDMTPFNREVNATALTIPFSHTPGRAYFVQVLCTEPLYQGAYHSLDIIGTVVDTTPPEILSFGVWIGGICQEMGLLVVTSMQLCIQLRDTECPITLITFSAGKSALTAASVSSVPLSSLTRTAGDYLLVTLNSFTTDSVNWISTDMVNAVGLTSNKRVVVMLDSTAPRAGSIYDGSASEREDVQCQHDPSALHAHWDAFEDLESGIERYEVGIGSAPNTTDIAPFRSVMTSRQVSFAGLSLAASTLYYVVVRGVNGVGLSTVSSSDGVTVLACSPTSDPQCQRAVSDCTNLRKIV